MFRAVSWRPLHHRGHDFSAVTLHCSYWKLHFGSIFFLKVKVEVAIWGNCGQKREKKKYVRTYLLQRMTSHTHPLCHHYPPHPITTAPSSRWTQSAHRHQRQPSGGTRPGKRASVKTLGAPDLTAAVCSLADTTGGWEEPRPVISGSPAGIKTAADAGGKTDLAGGASRAHALTGMSSLWRLVHLRQADRL